MAITKTVELYDDQGEIVTRELPAFWEICEYCEGEGSYLGLPYDGTFLPSDIAEDPDMLRDIRPVRCGQCGGTGKTLVIDDRNLSPEDQAVLDRHRELRSERAASAAYSAAERAVGA